MKTETQEIKVICAWCNNQIGTKEVPVNPQIKEADTHGICPACYDKFMDELGDLKK